MRYDLAFFLCCCKSFLGSDDQSYEFYDLLGVDIDASTDEIKRAYKRKSLSMHPDKLAQQGKAVTDADQARFTRMKEAYEVLSDPHKRETYDAIGERGMKWIDEPFSMDPQELAHNFAKSSMMDRSKIFAIFVGLAIALLILPIMVCLNIDGILGDEISWVETLTPLWLWNIFVLFYHSRVIMMGPIDRPEHVPPQEWVDPLPMKRRFFSLFRFALLVAFEMLVAMKLDGQLQCAWAITFIPLYLWEATTLYKKWPLAQLRIVTVDELETAMGKPFVEFTQEEKELIGKRYSVVSSTASPDYEAAQKLKTRARKDMTKCIFRVVFIAFLVVQLDTVLDMNWWIVFTPVWMMCFALCVSNYQAFAEIQLMAAEKDPGLFSLSPNDYGISYNSSNYGSVGDGGNATLEATKVSTDSQINIPGMAAAAAESSSSLPLPPQSHLSEEERDKLKAEVLNGGWKMCSRCCWQGFILVLICLVVAKLQGAEFSSLWIISPFLFASGIILGCLGCAIFGISEVPPESMDESGHFVSLVDEKSTQVSTKKNFTTEDLEAGDGRDRISSSLEPQSQVVNTQNTKSNFDQEESVTNTKEEEGTTGIRELD